MEVLGAIVGFTVVFFPLPLRPVTYLQNRNRLTDLENKLMVTKGEGWGEGIDWGFGTDTYTLLYLK